MRTCEVIVFLHATLPSWGKVSLQPIPANKPDKGVLGTSVHAVLQFHVLIEPHRGALVYNEEVALADSHTKLQTNWNKLSGGYHKRCCSRLNLEPL